MSECSERQKAFMDDVANSVPEGWNIGLGSTDEHIGATYNEYIQHCVDVLEALDEGADAPVFISFIDWRDKQREEHDDDLGFARNDCECCGTSMAGQRYAATALPPNPVENKDYIALEICQNCLLYVANGDVPDDENL